MKAQQQLPFGLLFTVFVIGATAQAGETSGRPQSYDVIVERDVMVPMRDGVKLATDLHFPASGGKRLAGKLPVVLMRTPYGKSSWGPD